MSNEIETEYEETVAVDERCFEIMYNGGCEESEDIMDFVIQRKEVRSYE